MSVVFPTWSDSFCINFWAGERLSLEKAQPRYLRPARPISVSAVPFGPGIDIWRSCRFIGTLMRSLCLLPGGLARFVPCFIGANHCRLRHIGWEKCGHGLTSRPRESVSVPFLDELLFLLVILLGLGVLCLLALFIQLIFLVTLFLVTRGGDVPRIMRGSFLLRTGQGWVNSLGCACPRLRLARSEISCLLRCMREVM